MALSKLEPDADRVKEIAIRMKEIIEITWMIDPSLNKKTEKEYLALKKEIEDMGMHVSYEIKINFDNPSKPKLEAEIDIWIPKNTTI